MSQCPQFDYKPAGRFKFQFFFGFHIWYVLSLSGVGNIPH
jgi:hypothetical protein